MASDGKTRKRLSGGQVKNSRIYAGMDEDRQDQERVYQLERAKSRRRDGGCVGRRMLKMMLQGKKKRRFMKRGRCSLLVTEGEAEERKL